MPEIILVRHGETEYNASETFRGRADVPLNEIGLKQARLLAEYLSSEKIDVVYSSPLKRAARTAGIIAAPHALEVNVVENLNDIDCGQWQGLPLKEVQESYEDIYQDWLDTPEQVRLPGGESLEDVRSRALPFVQDAVMRCGEGKIVFVSHRAVNKVLICALLRLDNSSFWSFKMDTAAITRFTFNGDRVVLTSHNDTSYLKPLKLGEKNDF
ncbi:MAG: histidine phosphatase family protein [Dehalococcoidales bacterium]|nr:histidine phosphatase family protein [Dehalococcoidales bacterium]